MAVTDAIILNNRQLRIPKELQKQVMNQQHNMGVETMGLLACESIYWIGINADIENKKKMFNMS